MGFLEKKNSQNKEKLYIQAPSIQKFISEALNFNVVEIKGFFQNIVDTLLLHATLWNAF